MERLGGHGPEHIRKTSQHGLYLSVSRNEAKFGPTSNTAEHEAWHVVASEGIHYATIIRQGDALGTTVPVRMTVAAAAAAGANGGIGTGHDEGVSRYMGFSWESAKAHGRAATAGKSLEHKIVANKLQKQGTIFNSDVKDAYKEAENIRKGVAKVDVYAIDNAGRKISYSTETSQSATEIANKLEEEHTKRHEEEVFKWTAKDQKLFEAETDRWSDHDQALFEAEADNQLQPAGLSSHS